jgi:hypothetical protein
MATTLKTAGASPVEEGFEQSTRCKFCGQFDEKIWPRVCENCFEMAVTLAEEVKGKEASKFIAPAQQDVSALLARIEKLELACRNAKGKLQSILDQRALKFSTDYPLTAMDVILELQNVLGKDNAK